MARCTIVPYRGRQMVRSPENHALELVNDVCALNAYGSALLVLAHGRENGTVTIHRLGYRSPVIFIFSIHPSCQARTTDTRSTQTRQIGSYNRPAVFGKPNGLTAICSMMQPLSFATGGADRAIHMWKIDHNLQTTYSEAPLAIRHTSLIYSLLPILDSGHKLISSGADCNLNVYDLSSERVVKSIKLSNPAFHVHQAGNPSTLLIQVCPLEHPVNLP